MRILLVDDDQPSRQAIAEFLTGQLNHQVSECENAAQALKRYREHPYPLVISDIRMPGISGIELLDKIKNHPAGRVTDVVLITGYGDMNSAIQALRAGAYEYMLKPIEIEELASVVERVSEHQSLLKENREFRQQFDRKVDEATSEMRETLQRLKSAYSKVTGSGRIGIFSEQMRDVRDLALKFHGDPTIPVLVEGETGTGKEIFARLIHYGDGEVTTPFVDLNCSAISANLVETELFGYEEGAFTDARKKGSRGKLELASGGTLFLDEIGDLPLDIQPKLLRVLEEREFYRVGGLKKIQVDIRIICATNQNLEKKVREGDFRQDLYYRLNVGRMVIPPLRERPEEIKPLAELFLKEFATQKKRRFTTIHSDAVARLMAHPWPGNVRELQNTIERAVLMYDEPQLRAHHIHFFSQSDQAEKRTWHRLSPGSIQLPEEPFDLREMEREIVRKALEKFNGNKTRTAAYLGLTRSALRSKLS